jgi:hypothetical protein
MWEYIKYLVDTWWYILGYKSLNIKSHDNTTDDIEWYKNYKDPLWERMSIRAQRFMINHEMDPIEYMDRIGIDRIHALALFDHRLRPWYDTKLIMNFYKLPDMTMVIIKDYKYITDLINYIYTDILSELGIISIDINESALIINTNDNFIDQNIDELIKLISQLSRNEYYLVKKKIEFVRP